MLMSYVKDRRRLPCDAKFENYKRHGWGKNSGKSRENDDRERRIGNTASDEDRY